MNDCGDYRSQQRAQYKGDDILTANATEQSPEVNYLKGGLVTSSRGKAELSWQHGAKVLRLFLLNL